MRPIPPATLAALMSPRRASPGDLIWPKPWWNDDLEWGLGWTKDIGGATATVDRLGLAKRTGSYGLYLQTRYDTPADNDAVQAGQLCLTPTQDYWTALVYAKLPSTVPSKYFDLHLACYNAGHKYTANLVHVTASDKWQYWSSGGALVDVPGGGYVWPDNTWVRLTLQIRKSTLRWATVTWPGGSADLSAQGLYDAGVDATTGARLELKLVANALAPTEAYADDWQLYHSPNP